ncbi:MAG TPA: hypothetical protein VEJ41_01235 [Candidatus Acidoferrales bacterium]|nr:hypothetical protein [Candidatus Acidoferrales bacterium]
MNRTIGRIAMTILALALACGSTRSANASANPYASVPSVGDSVRFDGSAGGETKAWAYPSQNLLESFLRSTIDASYQSQSYDQYQKTMSAVLASSLEFPNGTSAVVQRVQQFTYRGHQDIEVQARMNTGPYHVLVWTTPAELVSAAGHRYLH